MGKLSTVSTRLQASAWGLLATAAIAAFAPSTHAQTAIVGSPIPSPIPVNPITGHGLRNSRPTIRSRRTAVPRRYSAYPRRSVRTGVRTAPTPRTRIGRDRLGQPFIEVNTDRVRVIQDRFGSEVIILDTDRGRVVKFR